MPEDYVLQERHDRVGLIMFNRAQSLNVISEPLIEELVLALETFDQDDTIGAMVVSGHPRAFSVGADVKQFAGISEEEMVQKDPIGMWDRIQEISKPIIAAVSGYALGGGCEIAMACDIIVASETAIFGQPEVNLGLIPGAGGTQRLTRLMGTGMAMEIILNDRRLRAEEALHHGLVTHVYPIEEYLDKAIELAQSIAAKAPRAVREAKKMIRAAQETSLIEGLLLERAHFYGLFNGSDAAEGVEAFLEKRDPEWHEYASDKKVE